MFDELNKERQNKINSLIAPLKNEMQKAYDEMSDIQNKSIVKQIQKIKDDKIKIDDQEIIEILTVNGIRFMFNDGSWGLIRASSNKPSLVIVTESPTSAQRKKNIFNFIDGLLQKTGKVGKYDQKI